MGKLRIGMTLKEVQHAIARPLTVLTANESLASPDCHYVVFKHWPPGISLMMVGKRLARIDIDSPEIATREGIRIGDAETEVVNAYSEHSTVWSAHHYYTDGKYLLVHSEDGKRALLFETDNLRITHYRVGTVTAVQYVEGCE